MSEDDKREGVDDLFGDLDEFFAPIDDVDWPEEGGEEAPARPAGEEPPGAAPGEDWDLDVAIPAQEELVGEEAGAGQAGPGEAPAAEDEGAAAPVADEGRHAREPSEHEDLESTAEMSGDDWERLRSRLGEEDEEADEPGDEAPRELTVEDLRRAPDAYADLSPSEQPGGPEEPDEEGPEEWKSPVEDASDDPVLPEQATFAPEGPAPPPPRTEEDASPDDVEAAAAHFASGLEPDDVERDLLSDLDEPEPPVAAPPPADVEPPAAAPPPADVELEVEPAAREEEEVEEAPVAAPTAQPVEEDEVEEPLSIGGEGAPTWQEPAAYVPDEDVPADAGAPPGGRNLTAAMASGVILAAAAIALLWIGKGPFVFLAIGIVLLGQGELYEVLRKQGFQPATAMGLIAGLFVMVGAYTRGASLQGEGAMLFGLAIGLMLSILWYMAAPPPSRRGLVANVGATMLGVVYVPFLASFGLLLLAVPGDNGRNLLLTVVGLTVLYDVCAYAIGTLWGSHPLAPTVSPRKSREGAFGATLIVFLVSLGIVPAIPPFTPGRAMGLALVIAVAAPLGDLAESAIKRDAGVKDMGSLLPGHGGVLDRIDAILFTAPAAYYFLRLVA